MFGFGSIYIPIISVSLPIALVTAVVLPHRKMWLIFLFDKLHNTPCNNINSERVQNFFVRVGMGSIGLFVVIVLGPIVVRRILQWWGRRCRDGEQSPTTAAAYPVGEGRGEGVEEGAPEEGEREERQSLISGENPDYHDLTSSIPRPSSLPPHHRKPIRHLRIHSFDGLPPPTMDDVTPPRSPWSYPVSPVYQPEFPKENSGRRRSPFNPIVPGMKTIWKESVDPVTGRKWRRKLVIYSGALDSSPTPDGELDVKEKDMFSGL